MGTLSFEQFVERLRVLLKVEIPDPVNRYASLFDDLGLDSFKAFELMIIVEGLAESMVPPMEVPEIFTLSDAYEYYEQLRAIELAES